MIKIFFVFSALLAMYSLNHLHGIAMAAGLFVAAILFFVPYCNEKGFEGKSLSEYLIGAAVLGLVGITAFLGTCGAQIKGAEIGTGVAVDHGTSAFHSALSNPNR